MRNVVAHAAFLFVPLAMLASADQAVVRSHAGFAIEDGACGEEVACLQRGPKAWTPSEMQTFEEAVRDIQTRPGGQEILKRAQEAGARRVGRFQVGLAEDKPQPGIGAALLRTQAYRGIHLYDRWFSLSKLRDTVGGKPGYRVTSQVLLHECFHAVDRFSNDPAFMTAAGFVSAGSRWRFSAATVPDMELMLRFEKMQPILESKHDVAGLSRLNRQLALARRPVRVPSMRAVTNPAEAFAEIGSHLIIDARARRYLRKDLVRYFDERVFGK
jgi:hypothetical protein